MKYTKKAAAAALLQGAAFLLLLYAAFQRGASWFILAACAAVWGAAGFYLIRSVAWPLWRFEQSLEDCLHADDGMEKRAEIENADMKKVWQLAEKYANFRTRENAARIFDKQTELAALQSQINPHFLYNTLDSIRGQALLDDNTEIARMVEALASFFRYSISRKGNLVTLREELANTKNYMLIQQYRFHNRFSLEISIDEEDEAAYDFLIPKLIIQPVVENAFFHGLAECRENGKVTIEIIVTEQHLILMISDNGKGMDARTLADLNARIHDKGVRLEIGERREQRNTGIALPNIHKRIRLLFGEEYGVNVYSTPGLGTDVEITIPANYERKGEHEDEEGNVAGQ